MRHLCLTFVLGERETDDQVKVGYLLDHKFITYLWGFTKPTHCVKQLLHFWLLTVDHQFITGIQKTYTLSCFDICVKKSAMKYLIVLLNVSLAEIW
jgi:hypothetical protein